MSVTYKDAIGNLKTTSMLLPGDSTTICAEKGTVQKMPGIVISELGSCVKVLPPDVKAPIRVKPTPPPPPSPPTPVRTNPPPKVPKINKIAVGGGPRGGMTATAPLVNDNYVAFLIEEGRISDTADVVKNTNIDLNLGGAGANSGDIVLRRPKVRREM
jgi:hypothetical protein